MDMNTGQPICKPAPQYHNELRVLISDKMNNRLRKLCSGQNRSKFVRVALSRAIEEEEQRRAGQPVSLMHEEIPQEFE